MIKHTPGPWTVNAQASANNYIMLADNRWIAAIQFNGELMKEKQEVNAALIGAAPEFLAALELANTLLSELNFSEWIPKTDAASIDIRQRINAAHVIASSSIAKATGGAA